MWWSRLYARYPLVPVPRFPAHVVTVSYRCVAAMTAPTAWTPRSESASASRCRSRALTCPPGTGSRAECTRDSRPTAAGSATRGHRWAYPCPVIKLGRNRAEPGIGKPLGDVPNVRVHSERFLEDQQPASWVALGAR